MPSTITAVCALCGLSAFFSASETALFSLGRAGRSRLRRESPIFGVKALELLGDPQRLLSTVLFGNMLVNVLIFSFAQKLVSQYFDQGDNWSLFLQGALPVVLILVLGEVLPKVLALCFPFKVALVAAYPLSWITVLLSPVVSTLSHIMPKAVASDGVFGADELEQLVEETTARGEIGETEGDLLKDLIRFDSLEATEIMIPRAEMTAFRLDKGRLALRELFLESHLAKIPVYSEKLDDITGVIHLREFVKRPGAELTDLVRTLPLYPEQMLASRLYKVMRQTGQKLALIVDEYGGTAGILTFKDILEEIVGEFNEDFVEEDPELSWNDDGTCRINGQLAVRDFEELTGRKVQDGPYLTMAGWLLETAGRMPRKGESFNWEGLTFRVSEISRYKLESIDVSGLDRHQIESSR